MNPTVDDLSQADGTPGQPVALPTGTDHVPAHAGGPSAASSTPPGARTRPAYRYDLDGLRAVAILLVAVYHVFIYRVSGGVDVFLLLSGFFVVGALMRGFRAGKRVRLHSYVPRLVRRLLPSLAVVLTAVMAATYFLLPRSRWATISEQTLASVQYRLNWLMATTGQEYGAADAAQSPLQHIWSMSVQGQLFIAVPGLLLVIWILTSKLSVIVRYRVLVVVLVVACAASFVYAMRSVQSDQAWAYYDTLARAWEYLAGALLALGVRSIRLPRALAHVAGFVGLALILVTGVLIDGAGTFPGLTALVPLGGAALLIVAGAGGPGRQGAVNGMLAWKPLSTAGHYAYTYYLWHWPVLLFTIAATGTEITAVTGTLVLLVSAVLSAATHKLVETPLRMSGAERREARHARSGGRALAGLVAIACVAAAFVAPTKWLEHVERLEEEAARQINVAQPVLSEFTGSASDFPEAIQSNPGALEVAFPGILAHDPSAPLIPDPTVAGTDGGDLFPDRCNLAPGESDPVWCEFGDPNADRVLAAVGGSHIRTWVDVLDTLGKEHGFKVRTAIKWSCTFFTGTDGINPGGFAYDCVEWNDAVMQDLLADPPDAVFSMATRFSGGEDFTPGAYVDAWAKLNAAGTQVVALRDNPYLTFTPNDCVVDGRLDDPACVVAFADIYSDVSPFDALDRRSIPLTQFVDLTSIYCPDGTCPLVQGGRVVYLDSSHLTASYAQTLGPILDQAIQPLLGWW